MMIYIRNMVCIRCILTVKSELRKLDIPFDNVALGEANIAGQLSFEKLQQLDFNLRQSGLELLENRKSVLVEKIKTAIIELVRFSDKEERVNISDYLTQKLNYDYTYMASVFSELQGFTIEKFYINHKVERVKELLIYDELNLKEISFVTKYCSAAHMSRQFKKITGFAPREFRQMQNRTRYTIEQICC